MLRPTLLRAGIFLLGVHLVLSQSVLAHNISMSGAKASVRKYGLRVLDDKHNSFVRFHLNCDPEFSGHNHYARCTVKYYNDFKSDSPVACKEKIQVFFQAHKFLKSDNYTYYMRHTSTACGRTTLADQPV